MALIHIQTWSTIFVSRAETCRLEVLSLMVLNLLVLNKTEGGMIPVVE
jgi:hypothetical protein